MTDMKTCFALRRNGGGSAGGKLRFADQRWPAFTPMATVNHPIVVQPSYQIHQAAVFRRQPGTDA